MKVKSNSKSNNYVVEYINSAYTDTVNQMVTSSRWVTIWFFLKNEK